MEFPLIIHTDTLMQNDKLLIRVETANELTKSFLFSFSA